MEECGWHADALHSGPLQEAVSWLLGDASSSSAGAVRGFLQRDPGGKPGSTGASVGEGSVSEPGRRWVGLDIGGTLCKVVMWEPCVSLVEGVRRRDTEDMRCCQGVHGSTKGDCRGGTHRLLVEVESHSPVPTACGSCTFFCYDKDAAAAEATGGDISTMTDNSAAGYSTNSSSNSVCTGNSWDCSACGAPARLGACNCCRSSCGSELERDRNPAPAHPSPPHGATSSQCQPFSAQPGWLGHNQPGGTNALPRVLQEHHTMVEQHPRGTCHLPCSCNASAGTLRFARFETWRVPAFLDALAKAKEALVQEASQHGPTVARLACQDYLRPRSLGVTGGGARRFYHELSALNWLEVCRADELSSLVRGIDLLVRVAPQDCFEYPGVSLLRGGVIFRPYSSPSDSPPGVSSPPQSESQGRDGAAVLEREQPSLTKGAAGAAGARVGARSAEGSGGRSQSRLQTGTWARTGPGAESQGRTGAWAGEGGEGRGGMACGRGRKRTGTTEAMDWSGGEGMVLGEGQSVVAGDKDSPCPDQSSRGVVCGSLGRVAESGTGSREDSAGLLVAEEAGPMQRMEDREHRAAVEDSGVPGKWRPPCHEVASVPMPGSLGGGNWCLSQAGQGQGRCLASGEHPLSTEVPMSEDGIVGSCSHTATETQEGSQGVDEEEREDEDDGEEASSGLQYPYLVVNIGSGVSVLRVDAPGVFERVGGSSLGGSTFLGLTMALTGCTSFKEALRLATRGDSSHVDMLVGDIYGGDYMEMGLKSTTVASSFGKLVHQAAALGKAPQGHCHQHQQQQHLHQQQQYQQHQKQEAEDLAKAALLMVTNNVGSLAMLHARLAGVQHILFSGSFLHSNKLAMRSLAAAVDFWSQGNMRAIFLHHEGHAGAIGAMLSAIHNTGTCCH